MKKILKLAIVVVASFTAACNISTKEIGISGVGSFLEAVPQAEPRQTGFPIPVCRVSTNSVSDSVSWILSADINNDEVISEQEMTLAWVAKTASLGLGRNVSPTEIFTNDVDGFTLEPSSSYGLMKAIEELDVGRNALQDVEFLCRQRDSDTKQESKSETTSTSTKSGSGGGGPPGGPGGGI